MRGTRRKSWRTWGEKGREGANAPFPYEFTLVGLEPSAETTKGRSKGRYIDLWIACFFLEPNASLYPLYGGR